MTIDSEPEIVESGGWAHLVTLVIGGGAALVAVGSPVGLVPAMGFMFVLGGTLGWCLELVPWALVGAWFAVLFGIASTW